MAASITPTKPFVGLRHRLPDELRTVSPASVSVHRRRSLVVRASRASPKVSGRPLRVAVVGGGPAGGAAAETLAKGGVETFLIERKLDNCKPCGGAIPLCMVGEFDLPLDIIDRRVTKMKMISPSNVAVDIGRTLKPHEYIGMVRREVLDAYLRDRAMSYGATVLNGLFLKMDKPTDATSPYVLHYNLYDVCSCGRIAFGHLGSFMQGLKKRKAEQGGLSSSRRGVSLEAVEA